MDRWIDVVTTPLGFAGFALFLVFTLLSRVVRRNRSSWLMPILVAMAVISLVGGIWLASLNQQSKLGAIESEASSSIPETKSSVTQITSGDQSPAVVGVTGNVTITVTEEDNNKGSKY